MIRDNSTKAEVAGKTTSAKLHFGAARVPEHGRVVAVMGADPDAVTLPPAVVSELRQRVRLGNAPTVI